MRRIGLLLLAVCLCVSMAPVTVSAAQSGNYTYEVIQGKAVINKYVGDEVNVVVPATIDGYPVAGVMQDTFRSLPNMRSLTFSEGIQWVGKYFIYGCESLEALHIPSTMSMVQIVEDSIADSYNCVTYLPDSCTALKTITVAPGNENLVVRDGVLYSKDMTALVMMPPADSRTYFEVPETVRTIGDDAFAHNENLLEVVLPDGIESIGYWAFNCCRRLEKLNLPAELRFLGQYAMNYTALKSLHIPAKLTVSVEPFYRPDNVWGGDGLTSLTVEDGNPVFYAVDNVLYKRYTDGEVLAMYASGKQDQTFTVPDHIMKLEAFCFSDAKYLEEIILPEGLKTIDYNAFTECTGLKELYIPDSVERINQSAFINCENLESVRLPEGLTEISKHLFGGCRKLTSVNIPDSVTKIGDNAFGICEGLTEITIPEGVKEISDSAFFWCKALTKVVLPTGVEKLGSGIFNGSGMETVVFRGNPPQFAADTFQGFSGNAVYNPNNRNWRDAVLQNYGGSVTWIGGEEAIPEPEPILGDFSGDGQLDSDDAIYLLYHTLFGGDLYPLEGKCDFDCNGSVDADDAIYLLYNTLFGDRQYPLDRENPMQTFEEPIYKFLWENTPCVIDGEDNFAAEMWVYTVDGAGSYPGQLQDKFEEVFGFRSYELVQKELLGEFVVDGYSGERKVYKLSIRDTAWLLLTDPVGQVFSRTLENGEMWIGFCMLVPEEPDWDAHHAQCKPLREEMERQFTEATGKTITEMRRDDRYTVNRILNRQRRLPEGGVSTVYIYYCQGPVL